MYVTRVLNKLPAYCQIVTILTDMRQGAKSSIFLKKFALILSSVLFLGSAEVAACSISFDSRLSLHKQDYAQAFDATDELFSESGEERDGESLSDVYLISADIPLAQPGLISENISFTVLTLTSFLFSSPQNTRAPPAL